MNEIERAIERNKMIKKLISEIGMIKAILRASDPLVPVVEPQRYEEYELIESILAAELSRQENAPLTCAGCKREESKKEYMHVICMQCTRMNQTRDRYEPKGATK